MPAARTALWLCQRTRFHVGVFDTALLRDGFSTDAGEADRAILPAINESITELIFTGQFKCTFSLAIQSGVRDYRLDPGIGTVLRATYSGMPVPNVKRTTLDRTKPGWQNTDLWPPSNPVTSYSTDIPDVLTVDPIPAFSDAAALFEFDAETLADDLVNPTDVITRLPSQFHDFIPNGAAAKILLSLGDTESLAKAEAHLSIWNDAKEMVQARAQNIEMDGQAQVAPISYQDFYRRNTWGGWW